MLNAEVKPHVTLLYLGGDLTDESAAKRANLNLREFQHAKEATIYPVKFEWFCVTKACYV